MRVLITGHNGYIGSVMAPFFQQAGHDVVGLDNFLFSECLHGPEPAGVDSLRRDLRDVVPEDLNGFDAVVHLAALSNDPLGNLEPQHTYDINHAASVRLAKAAKVAGVTRFLYSSSCSIYGASDIDSVLDETAPMTPVTPYAESKVLVEADLRDLADDAFSPVYMRNATAYGWSPRLRCDIVLNDLIAVAMLTGRVLVLSDGTPWRPMVHIEDISRAFLAALEAPKEAVHDQALNVGAASENYQVLEIAQTVADTVPGSQIVVTSETGPDPRSYRVDFSKIGQRLPAFKTEWDLRRGAQQLHEHYERHGMPEEQYRNLYKRLPWITRLLNEGRLDPTLRWRDEPKAA